ncbi:MAG: hypothetical protein RM049_07575 [Nostoc sp. DedQUE04]|uniref:hypothetical protein n=1 Tax=Nostoc sp. DedQUE04 TaxID=3075390 RepID=UPI002AD3410A|nr:hypothetical protein [Nostoc sp. DedQUE04]MDZ8135150.1 hypothetical protein [Nostoc sp. DedQUE04]
MNKETETDIEKLLRLQNESYQELKLTLGLEGKSQIELLAISLALTKLATEARELAGDTNR